MPEKYKNVFNKQTGSLNYDALKGLVSEFRSKRVQNKN